MPQNVNINPGCLSGESEDEAQGWFGVWDVSGLLGIWSVILSLLRQPSPQDTSNISVCLHEYYLKIMDRRETFIMHLIYDFNANIDFPQVVVVLAI